MAVIPFWIRKEKFHTQIVIYLRNVYFWIFSAEKRPSSTGSSASTPRSSAARWSGSARSGPPTRPAPPESSLLQLTPNPGRTCRGPRTSRGRLFLCVQSTAASCLRAPQVSFWWYLVKLGISWPNPDSPSLLYFFHSAVESLMSLEQFFGVNS